MDDGGPMTMARMRERIDKGELADELIYEIFGPDSPKSAAPTPPPFELIDESSWFDYEEDVPVVKLVVVTSASASVDGGHDPVVTSVQAIGGDLTALKAATTSLNERKTAFEAKARAGIADPTERALLHAEGARLYQLAEMMEDEIRRLGWATSVDGLTSADGGHNPNVLDGDGGPSCGGGGDVHHQQSKPAAVATFGGRGGGGGNRVRSRSRPRQRRDDSRENGRRGGSGGDFHNQQSKPAAVATFGGRGGAGRRSRRRRYLHRQHRASANVVDVVAAEEILGGHCRLRFLLLGRGHRRYCCCRWCCRVEVGG